MAEETDSQTPTGSPTGLPASAGSALHPFLRPEVQAKRRQASAEAQRRPESRELRRKLKSEWWQKETSLQAMSRATRDSWKNEIVRDRRIAGIKASGCGHKGFKFDSCSARKAQAKVDRAKQLAVNARIGREREGGEMPPGPGAKGEGHWKALFWKVRDYRGVVHEGKNLNEIIRRNVHLFDAADVVWKKSRCRASQGIRQLFAGRPNGPVSWKGWTAVLVTHPGDDPLERQNAPTLARAGEDAAITDPLPTARCQQ